MTLRSTLIAAVVIFFDQLTKFLISVKFSLHESRPLLSNIFYLTRVHNTGIAFGLFKGKLSTFIFISFMVVFFILLCASRFRTGCGLLRIGLLFILAGTIGNLIDRLRLGYVIDFIDLRIWPVFNIADIAISTGAILLIIHLIGKRHAPSLI